MKRAKKDRSGTAIPKRSCPGLAPRTPNEIIITNSRQNASPNFGQGRGCPPYVLGAGSCCDRDRLADQPAIPPD